MLLGRFAWNLVVKIYGLGSRLLNGLEKNIFFSPSVRKSDNFIHIYNNETNTFLNFGALRFCVLSGCNIRICPRPIYDKFLLI